MGNKSIYDSKQWGVSVQGPGNALAAHSFQEAVNQCNRINSNIVRIKDEFDSEYHPLIWANVDLWENMAPGLIHDPDSTDWDEVC